MMNTLAFPDYYNNTVRLSLSVAPFSTEPKHVWIICRYNNQWLLTSHPRRGLEFPGGKVEDGETPEEAAVREVYEETGGIVRSLHYIGQYEVHGQADQLIKNIYFAEIEEIDRKINYLETDGPRLIPEMPDNIKHDPTYSFIMKDDVLTVSLEEIKQRFNAMFTV
ncbi:RNA deprotection pyrophosphohydrolase [Anaerobacillus sp. MEB173]|uniref:RNA deprotection pyrophosphohydrolase n=1 Tax=Anaerobacillus sp. MEB173 TaxID=3383345 RepID=UPI003F8E9412